MATRIKEKYLAEAVPALQQKFGYKNVMQIPRIVKAILLSILLPPTATYPRLASRLSAIL